MKASTVVYRRRRKKVVFGQYPVQCSEESTVSVGLGVVLCWRTKSRVASRQLQLQRARRGATGLCRESAGGRSGCVIGIASCSPVQCEKEKQRKMLLVSVSRNWPYQGGKWPSRRRNFGEKSGGTEADRGEFFFVGSP